VSPARAKLHGHMPDRGVWSHEGRAEREHARMSIGKDLVLRHDEASNSQNDFLYANTFFANGSAPLEHSSTTRHCHLDHNLVPFTSMSPHSEGKVVNGRHSAEAAVASPPGRRISAIEFDDGGPPSNSPQRVPMDGAWRLTSSLSANELRSGDGGSGGGSGGGTVEYRRHAGASRKVSAPSDHAFQSENHQLWGSRAAQRQHERRREHSWEDETLSEFPQRWGFPQSAALHEIPIRRRANLECASRVTLTGSGCSFHR